MFYSFQLLVKMEEHALMPLITIRVDVLLDLVVTIVKLILMNVLQIRVSMDLNVETM